MASADDADMTTRRPKTEIIRGHDGEITHWQPPRVGGRAQAESGKERNLLTAAQLDEIRAAAQAEGYEQGRKEGQAYGHREGIEQGRADIQAKIDQLDAMLGTLARPFEQLDQQVEQEIVTLVINMVRQLIRREVKLDPGQIVGVVREALGVLPVSARNVRVVLHPEDAVLVREAYALGDRDQQWQIVEDPVIQRGGCRITTDTSQIDATLDSRLSSLIAPLLAGERVQDNDEKRDHEQRA
jgi:flagellar assembly protein FliH